MNLDTNSIGSGIVEKRPWRLGIEYWTLYKCKVCLMWCYAVSQDESRVAYLMNINATGLMSGILARGSNLSVPVLNKLRF